MILKAMEIPRAVLFRFIDFNLYIIYHRKFLEELAHNYYWTSVLDKSLKVTYSTVLLY